MTGARASSCAVEARALGHRSSIANPESAIPNPQSAIRNPQSAIRNRQLSLAVLCLAACAVLAEEECRFHGTLSPSEPVSRVVLLDRDVPQQQVQREVKINQLAVDFDAKTGVFKAVRVEPDRAYDLYVELTNGVKLEGVDLRPRVESDAPFPDSGRVAIERHFYGMKQFTNENRILAIVGNDKSAAVLVELCRTTEFHAGGGDVVWRIERWDYANEWGAWQPRGTRVLRRFRLGRSEWPGIRWYFVPAWGNLRAQREPFKVTLPDLAGLPGRYPGVEKGSPRPADERPRKKHEEDLKGQKDDALAPLKD